MLLRLILLLPLVATLSTCIPQSLNALPAQIIIIRHAEKSPEGNSLNIKGRERANALIPYLQETKELSSNGPIAAIYAVHPSKANPAKHAVETVTPISKALSITINIDFDEDDFKKLVEEIKNNPDNKEKTVLICWSQQYIPQIARAFGALQSPGIWRADAYDRTWIISLNKGGKPTFQNLPQRLLFGDSAS